jgi:hypothetical protein
LEFGPDSREAPLGKGVRSMSTSALEVEHTHKGGWNSTTTARRTAAARGAALSGGDDIISAADKKPRTEGFG